MYNSITYPYVGGSVYQCSCPGCPSRTYWPQTTTTTWTLPGVYVPKHRKPGPAR